MSANLRRLQGLGMALGDEVETQNQLLDRINTKTDKTDTTIRKQDDQMKKILGVKDAAPGTAPPTIKGGDAAAGSSKTMTPSASGSGWSSKKWF